MTTPADGAPTSAPAKAAIASDDEALADPFVRALVRQMRAHDTSGAWERKSDAELLEPYVVSREKRRAIPVIADPDARTVWRIEQFYSAVSLCIEQEAGHIAAPLLKLTHEGFGRVVLICGRLVVVSKIMRDAHRFGFDTLAALASEGRKLVSEGAELIRTHPEVASL